MSSSLHSHVRARGAFPIPFAALFAWMAVLASGPASAQSPDFEPFERLGARLIELADERAGPNANTSDTTTTRLAPLHDAVRLGAYELWAPFVTLDAKGRVNDGARAKDLVDRGARLVELQRHWLEWASQDAPTTQAAREALDVVAAWWKPFKALPHPAPTAQVRSAVAALEAHFGLPMRSGRRLTLIHAPTRAHYTALLGARGVLSDRMRAQIWTATDRTSPFAALRDGSTAYATTWALGHEGSAVLEDAGMSASDAREWFTHCAAHQLVYWLVPMAPAWMVEALSIETTIALCGADETSCSGCREIEVIPTWWMDAMEALSFVGRDKSPYRGGSSTYFAKQLRAARRDGGFLILNLEREAPGEIVRGPLLGAQTRTPSEVVSGGVGVRKGYAEFFRAYCTAFVAFLKREDPKRLAQVLQALRRVPLDTRPKSSALHDLVREHFQLTLGESEDPTTDLEARFRASLGR